MKPPPFEWVAVSDLDECVQHLAEAADTEVKVVAGGQSLIPMLALRMATPSRLVDINNVEQLKTLTVRSGEVLLGALVRHTDLAEDCGLRRQLPIIGRAALHIGHVGIRNRGTLAGSLAHADPAAELPAVMTLLDATFTCLSVRGAREVAAADFFSGPYTTALQPDELLAGVRIPLPSPRKAYGFVEFATREGDFARAGAACSVEVERGGCCDPRLVLFAVGSMPIEVTLPGWSAPHDTTAPGLSSIAQAVDACVARVGDAGHQSRLARLAAERAIEQALGEAPR